MSRFTKSTGTLRGKSRLEVLMILCARIGYNP